MRIRMVDASVQFYSQETYVPVVHIHKEGRTNTYFPSGSSVYRLQRTIRKLIKAGQFEVVVPLSSFIGWRARRI